MTAYEISRRMSRYATLARRQPWGTHAYYFWLARLDLACAAYDRAMGWRRG